MKKTTKIVVALLLPAIIFIWMVGWILMLEYAIGYIAVACAWSNHLMQLLKGFSRPGKAGLIIWLSLPGKK